MPNPFCILRHGLNYLLCLEKGHIVTIKKNIIESRLNELNGPSFLGKDKVIDFWLLNEDREPPLE